MSYYCIFLIISALTLLHVNAHHNQTHCVRDQQYWLSLPSMNWTNGIADRKICGSSWYDVMKIETVQLRDEINSFWFMSFHQICTASLNDHPIEIDLAITTLYDSLERGCSNITKWSSQWRYDKSVFTLYTQLYQFNSGQMENDGYPSCTDEFKNNTFTFYNMSDLFLIILPTNETVSEGSIFLSAVVSHIFRLNAYFTAFTICTIILIIVVSVMLAMFASNRRYKFYCCKPDTYTDIELNDVNSDDLSIDLSGEDMNVSNSDLDDCNKVNDH